jgi:hypothetical protein
VIKAQRPLVVVKRNQSWSAAVDSESDSHVFCALVELTPAHEFGWSAARTAAGIASEPTIAVVITSIRNRAGKELIGRMDLPV